MGTMDPSPSREAPPRARRQTCYRADLSERLRSRLAEHGLSQGKLSQHTSIDRSTLSKILNGKRRPTAAQLGALAYVLDLEFDELLVLPASSNELDELRAERDEATRRADEAEAAHRREETARARAELNAADRVAESLSLRAERDEAIRRADEAEAAHRREETVRARAELTAADHVAELSSLRAERDEAIRRADAAEAAHKREETARARAASASKEQVAELEAKLDDAARVRQNIEAELKRVEQELAIAKLRLGEFKSDGGKRDPKRASKHASDQSREWPVELIDIEPQFDEHYARVRRNRDMIESVGGALLKCGSALYFYRALARSR